MEYTVLEDDDPSSYHMYAMTYQIDRRFDQTKNTRNFQRTQKRTKLIADGVVNHWSLEHYMIKDLPLMIGLINGMNLHLQAQRNFL